MLKTFDDDGSTPEDVDEAITEFITAGLYYAERNDAPGLKQDILDFAKALDGDDFVSIDEFINNMLAYCEPYFDRQAGV